MPVSTCITVYEICSNQRGSRWKFIAAASLDGQVHSYNLAMGPRMFWLCQPAFDPLSLTGAIEWTSAPEGCRPERFFGSSADWISVLARTTSIP
jgi:hypothetical protein